MTFGSPLGGRIYDRYHFRHNSALGMSQGVSISTRNLSLQLDLAGYHGPAIDAKPQLLSLTISNVMIIAAALCLMGAAAFLRNRGGS